MKRNKIILVTVLIMAPLSTIASLIGGEFDLYYTLFAIALGTLLGIALGYMIWRITYYKSFETLFQHTAKNPHKKVSKFDEIDLLIIVVSIIVTGIFVNLIWKGNIIANIIGLYGGWVIGRLIIHIFRNDGKRRKNS